MIVQKVAFFIACLIFGEWFILFFIRISEHKVNTVPAIGQNLAPVFGTIMFNYAMVVTVPSWCNEKTHSTRINPVMGGATLVGTILFFMVGWLGAIAYTIDPDGDLLSAINDIDGTLYTQIGVYVFPLAVVATSIPIYSIIVRYNLIENQICGKAWANFFAVVLPWLVVIPFYTGNGLENVINWSTLFSNGIINFIIPFMLYIKARRRKMELTYREKNELDMPITTTEKGESYCFDRIHTEDTVVVENPHFAFGKCFSDDSYTPIIISAVFVSALIISNIGILIINIMQVANVY
eukprot:TRINITY_DN4763_c0_g1_i1.p1 TRINITY_DN4763_c0_g1~~TRINITY_DN4763_c0_g1_i1.p1  ORF type:complete len:321 (-),score=42.02 TRINITY_DN4763_c0_g1_i1:62-943(-)